MEHICPLPQMAQADPALPQVNLLTGWHCPWSSQHPVAQLCAVQVGLVVQPASDASTAATATNLIEHMFPPTGFTAGRPSLRAARPA
jgi:hypothetical protein